MRDIVFYRDWGLHTDVPLSRTPFGDIQPQETRLIPNKFQIRYGKGLKRGNRALVIVF